MEAAIAVNDAFQYPNRIMAFFGETAGIGRIRSVQKVFSAYRKTLGADCFELDERDGSDYNGPQKLSDAISPL